MTKYLPTQDSAYTNAARAAALAKIAEITPCSSRPKPI